MSKFPKKLDAIITTTVQMRLETAQAVRDLCHATKRTLRDFVAVAVEREIQRVRRKAALNGGTTV